MPPRLAPADGQRIGDAVEAAERRRALVFAAPRQRAGVALRRLDARQGRPARAAARGDAVAPRQLMTATDARGVQNDSRGLASKRGQRLQHGAHCIERKTMIGQLNRHNRLHIVPAMRKTTLALILFALAAPLFAQTSEVGFLFGGVKRMRGGSDWKSDGVKELYFGFQLDPGTQFIIKGGEIDAPGTFTINDTL